MNDTVFWSFFWKRAGGGDSTPRFGRVDWFIPVNSIVLADLLPDVIGEEEVTTEKASFCKVSKAGATFTVKAAK